MIFQCDNSTTRIECNAEVRIFGFKQHFWLLSFVLGCLWSWEKLGTLWKRISFAEFFLYAKPPITERHLFKWSRKIKFQNKIKYFYKTKKLWFSYLPRSIATYRWPNSRSNICLFTEIRNILIRILFSSHMCLLWKNNFSFRVRLFSL